MRLKTNPLRWTKTGEVRGAGAPYVCPECGEKFTSTGVLGPHLERHRPVQPARYSQFKQRCGMCFGTGRSKETPVEECRGCDGEGRRRKLLTPPCTKGCGRFFESKIERVEHMKVCDGGEPLEMKSCPMAGVAT